ncbi:toprim domain-containing protein [Escherichia coli]
MTTLVIVESPNKVSKISAILGDGYKVMASVGHVRDLPPKELGIEPPSFELTYQPTERGQGVLAKLKAAVAQADRVLLATDPTAKARRFRGTLPTRYVSRIPSA